MSLNKANSSKQFATDHQNLLLLEKSRICEKLESIHEVVNTKISVYCKYCANFYGSIANFFWHRISDHFYWSKEHLHQVWKLYPKMHYFAIFEGLQTLLIRLWEVIRLELIFILGCCKPFDHHMYPLLIYLSFITKLNVTVDLFHANL